MENNNEKQEFEFTLVSFFRMFKGKLKMLVAIGVISAILGGTIGALIATTGNKSYGNTLSFQLPTAEKHEYAALIPLLESDQFAETILIGTKTVKVTDTNGKTTDVEIPNLQFTKEDEKKIAAYELAKTEGYKTIEDYKNRIEALPLEINTLKSQLDAANNVYSPLRDEYNRLWAVYSDGLSEDAKEKLTALESSEKYITAKKNHEAAQAAYDAKLIEQASLEAAIFDLEKSIELATDAAEIIIEPLREEWLQKSENKAAIKSFKNNVKFSFVKDEKAEKTDKSKNNFIHVSIEIPKDAVKAEKIVKAVSTILPGFVMQNSVPTEKYDQIKCIRISSAVVNDLNDTSLIKSTITYALILFIALEAITCIVIIGAHIRKIYLPLINADDESKAKEKEEIEENSESNE